MPALLRTAPPRARRWLGAVVVACAPLLAAGCGDSATGASDVAGSYDLVAFNGRSLPYTYSDAAFTYTVLDGQLLLSADRTYRVDATARVVDRYTGSTELDDEESTGTYTLSGNRLTLHPSGGTDALFDDGDVATVSGSTVTLGVFTFVRR